MYILLIDFNILELVKILPISIKIRKICVNINKTKGVIAPTNFIKIV